MQEGFCERIYGISGNFPIRTTIKFRSDPKVHPALPEYLAYFEKVIKSHLSTSEWCTTPGKIERLFTNSEYAVWTGNLYFSNYSSSNNF